MLLIVIGLLLPARPRVEREVWVDAHAATVFALLNDFHQFNRWSNWMESDPNVRFAISGPVRGVGATLSWDGQILGAGRQTIVESVPFERIRSTLGVTDPESGSSDFSLSPSGDGTLVVRGYERDFGINLAGRYFGLLLDGIIGPDYEQGLAQLKELAENLPHADFSLLAIEEITVESTAIAYRRTTSVPLATAISEAMGEAYFDVLNFIDEQGLEADGAPLSITRTFNGSELVFDAAIPVTGSVDRVRSTSGTATVRLGSTYAGLVIRVQHVGPYRTLGETHNKIAAYLAAMGIERNGDTWESYVSDPTRIGEAELLTYVYYPVRPQRER